MEHQEAGNGISLKLPSQLSAFCASGFCPKMGFRFCFLVEKACVSSVILSCWVLRVVITHMLLMVNLSVGM